MIYLIAGATHTGKTALAQKLLETCHYPYLSIDHLKMGLIRSGNTDLTPMDDEKLTDYLWPILREMIKTAIENGQNLIVEGCYIPFSWQADFSGQELAQIRYLCLIFSKPYLQQQFTKIVEMGNVIEQRLDNDLDLQALIEENERNLSCCLEYGCPYCLVETCYDQDVFLKKLL